MSSKSYRKEAQGMLYAGLDLSRKRLDFELLADSGERVLAGAVPPDADGLRGLAGRVSGFGEPVRAAVESMNGARFVHDQLELLGWRVEIADALKVKGLAPLACKTDKIDSHVLAELCRRDLVPAIWLPTPEVRGERERARFRLHLVRQRTRLKSRIHATLLAFGHPCPVSDLFGVRGRALLEQLALPEPWRGDVDASLRLIDQVDREIAAIERELRSLGSEHRYVPLLMTIPGIAWILGYTIAAEIGEIERFSAPKKLVGYTGLCPKVIQSGGQDRRGPLAKNGPKYLRWAYIEAATHACRYHPYRDPYQQTKQRLGRNRGAKVATITVARKLAEASWWMLSKGEPFAPTGATQVLAA
ncbi:MAG TPA: IS110 family transposase [Gaiellaceae bacterium]|nr:IS110 family transposase [Gaiellaceae bacterium]